MCEFVLYPALLLFPFRHGWMRRCAQLIMYDKNAAKSQHPLQQPAVRNDDFNCVVSVDAIKVDVTVL